MITNLKELRKIILVTLLFALLISCGSERKSKIVYLYPKDKSQVISIISNYNKNERIIALGKYTSTPKNNYILLDISGTTKLDDQIGICWDINGHKWEMVNDKAKVLENTLDTSKYVFRENWFRNDQGIPNTKYYIKENCFTVGFLNYSKPFPKQNGVIERYK